MNKEWVQRNNEEVKREYENNKKILLKEIQEADYIPDKKRTELMNCFYKEDYLSILKKYYSIFADLLIQYIKQKKYSDDELDCLRIRIDQIIDIAESIVLYKQNLNLYNDYLDSDPMEFDGDIIITDPCYIMRSKHHGTTPMFKDDWKVSKHGFNLKKLGINNYMTRDTINGDWYCHICNEDTGDLIGEFCADSGLVSVMNLKEVLKYNPDFNYHIERFWTMALIENFKGTVQFVVEKDLNEFEDFSLTVVGHGVNKVTGEPINFTSYPFS